MAGTGSVSTDPLFVGLTRPTMIFGVSFKFFFFNFFISLLAYVNAPGLKVIFLGYALLVLIFVTLVHGSVAIAMATLLSPLK